MLLLAIDTCLTSASVAVSTEEKLLGQFYIDNKLTHSVKLIPLITGLLSELDLALSDIDVFACTNGPGSFTGIRIGIATVKGLATPADKPVISVSSLETMAYNFLNSTLPVCPIIDARNSQVFYAAYKQEKGKMVETTAPAADDVSALVQSISSPTLFVGDGSIKYKNVLEQNKNIIIAPPHLLMPSAAACAVAAFEKYKTGGALSVSELEPLYIRKSSAEQEKERMNNK